MKNNYNHVHKPNQANIPNINNFNETIVDLYNTDFLCIKDSECKKLIKTLKIQIK